MALPPIEGVTPPARSAGLTPQDRTERSGSEKTPSSSSAKDSVELSDAALKKLEADQAAEENTARQTAAEVRNALTDNTDITL